MCGQKKNSMIRMERFFTDYNGVQFNIKKVPINRSPLMFDK